MTNLLSEALKRKWTTPRTAGAEKRICVALEKYPEIKLKALTYIPKNKTRNNTPQSYEVIFQIGKYREQRHAYMLENIKTLADTRREIALLFVLVSLGAEPAKESS